MTEVKIDSGDWVVACDGRKAMILENAGSRASPRLQVKEVRMQDDPRASELGSDVAGGCDDVRRGLCTVPFQRQQGRS